MLTIEEMESRVNYHTPTNRASECHSLVRQVFMQALIVINAKVPDCREKSVAITELETAMFWANAGIARNHDKL